MRKMFVIGVVAAALGCGGKTVNNEPTAPPASGSASTGGQSFAQAMQTVCDSPEQSGVDSAPAESRAQQLASWIDAHLTNEEARQWFAARTSEGNEERLTQLDAALAKAGIAPDACPFRAVMVPPPGP